MSIPTHVLPAPEVLAAARGAIHRSILDQGLGTSDTISHLEHDIVPGLNAASKSSRYYGFVTGGSLPAALAADHLVSQHDQNVSVHLPSDTIATDVEYHTLNMLCQMLDLDPEEWTHKVFSTGATASNIIGMACAREHVIAQAANHLGLEIQSAVTKFGLHKAMSLAGIDDIQVLCTMPHSSLRKACSIIGLGHDSVVDAGLSEDNIRFDFLALEERLKRARTASIISISCSEVNTGFFATSGSEEMTRLRDLADRYGAWLHVDAAIGLLARILPQVTEFEHVRKGVQGLELADSIAGDAHKLFNVPYDCGIFLSKHLSIGVKVCQNPGAPYLSSSISAIPSPCNIGIENSRRFRALPVYSNLVALGKAGYQEMLIRQIRFARKIAEYLVNHESYQLLPQHLDNTRLDQIYMIVIFRAKDQTANERLLSLINNQREIFCSGTMWNGQPATRFAVSNWQVDVERDWTVVQRVLEYALKS